MFVVVDVVTYSCVFSIERFFCCANANFNICQRKFRSFQIISSGLSFLSYEFCDAERLSLRRGFVLFNENGLEHFSGTTRVTKMLLVLLVLSL